MFTCGLAADILFYSFAEWAMYATSPHIEELGSITEWAGVFPLVHWSFIPWAFYLVLAVVVGFMLHVRKRIARDIQRLAADYRKACRWNSWQNYRLICIVCIACGNGNHIQCSNTAYGSNHCKSFWNYSQSHRSYYYYFFAYMNCSKEIPF